ncbi:hypothetical protein JCM8547_004443 [Rhodosporidiobolus lusitaniae]
MPSSPSPPTATTTTHSRSASEIQLASLTLDDPDDMLISTASGGSRLSDLDLLDDLPPLPGSVMEEAEGQFLDLAHLALAAYSKPSPPPSSGAGSPSSSRSRRSSPDVYSDPSYFALTRRNLYASPDSSWSSTPASSCYSASSTPSLASTYGDASVHSTPAHSPAPPSCEYFSTAYAPASPILSYAAPFSTSSFSSPPSPTVTEGGKPSLYSRRPRASLTSSGLKLSLPPASPPYRFATLRGSKSFSFALQPSDERPAPREKPRWVKEMEEIAGVSSLAAAAAVESAVASTSRERQRRREKSAVRGELGGEPGSPIRLKDRVTSEWAF